MAKHSDPNNITLELLSVKRPKADTADGTFILSCWFIYFSNRVRKNTKVKTHDTVSLDQNTFGDSFLYLYL